MAVEAQSVWMKETTPETVSTTDHLNTSAHSEPSGGFLDQDTTLNAALFEEVEFEEAPPMIQAMRLLGRLLDPDLAQRALEVGDDGALGEGEKVFW